MNNLSKLKAGAFFGPASLKGCGCVSQAERNVIIQDLSESRHKTSNLPSAIAGHTNNPELKRICVRSICSDCGSRC